MSLESEGPLSSVPDASADLPIADLSEGLLLAADSELRPWVSVVMPTLNEEDGIARCIEQATAAIETLGVPAEILVSDSSTDRTPDIAEAMGAIVVEPDRPGYGYAYRYAFERARGAYVVMGDADCTYDFGAIPDLIEPVVDGEADLVMGSRFDGEIRPGAMPALHRYVGNPLLTRFLNAFYDAGVSDAHSGFRVFRRGLLAELELRSDGMEFASEMVMEVSARGLEIVEVPITYNAREGEATLNSFEDGWDHVKFMLVNAPGYLFSVPGILLSAAGVTVMALTLLGVSIGPAHAGVNSLIAGSLLTLVGFQVASLGVFATVAGDPIRKPTDPVTELVVAHANLERGATVGLGVFAVGALYGAVMLVRWVESGFSTVPLLEANVVAFTAIVLGMQLVFGSFFLSVLNEQSRRVA